MGRSDGKVRLGATSPRDIGAMSPPGIAGLFPGQGSEYPGMLRPLAGHPCAAQIFSRIRELSGRDLYGLAMDGPEDALRSALNAQLSVFGVSACYWELLKGRYGFSALTGHSLGFYTALYAAGSIGFDDAVNIIVEAHRAIEETAGEGQWAMAAIIGLKVEDCEELCAKAGGVYVANINSATQAVVSGRADMVKYVSGAAIERGALNVRHLPIAYPLHSPFMSGIEGRLMPVVRRMKISEPQIPVQDHTGGGRLDGEGIKGVLSGQLQRKVLWRDAVLGIGADRFIEVGPSDVLTKLVRWIDRDAEVMTAEMLCPKG